MLNNRLLNQDCKFRCVSAVNWILLVYFFYHLFGFTGCSNANGFDTVDPVAGSRGVSIDILWPPGHIPDMSQSYFIVISPGLSDYVSTSDLVTSVEIDPGDGSGWHDITSYFFEHMTGHGNWVGNGAWPITYTAPGTYHVFARARFYDGELVTSDRLTTIIPASAGT